MMAGSSLSRPFKLLMVAAIVAMVAAALPAIAQNNPVADPLVFGPDPTNPGQGDTFSCADGPPFTVPAPPGNCVFVNFGPPPAGLVCDIPTTVFFLSSPGRSEAAFTCHTPSQTTPQPTPQTTPQPTPQPTPAPQQQVCPPASQGLAERSTTGNVADTFRADGAGDNSDQTAAPLQFGNSGPPQNAQGVLQECGSQSGDIGLSGGSMTFGPTLDAPSNQEVGQSSGASGQ